MALPKINTAKYETTIPSTGRAVEYRPYLVKEEKILMIALESQDQKQVLRAVKDVIESCVFDKINVNNLAIFDVESLFISLRSKSVGEGVEVNIKCEECENQTFKQTLLIRKMSALVSPNGQEQLIPIGPS